MGVNKEHNKDGVYILFDGYFTILTIKDGIRSTNIIRLDTSTVSNISDYITRLTTRLREYIKKVNEESASDEAKEVEETEKGN